MRILGTMMVRNGQETIGGTLDQMALYCDAVFVLDDRSTDETRRICEAHPIVRNVFSARNDVSNRPWFHPESRCLDFLYRMADFDQPDWVVQLDDDQTLEPGAEVRAVLESVPPETAALRIPLASTWSDPAYPDLVPVMGSGRSMNGAIWRYYPGLDAGGQPLHNFRLPSNIGEFGKVEEHRELTIVHRGWDTLAKRIERVDFYTALDPDFRFNHGVPYDRGLLFGFGRTEVPQLVEAYRSRLASTPSAGD